MWIICLLEKQTREMKLAKGYIYTPITYLLLHTLIKNIYIYTYNIPMLKLKSAHIDSEQIYSEIELKSINARSSKG